MNYDKCKPLSLPAAVSRPICLCLSLCLASIQPLHNRGGEKLLAVQTGGNYTGLEADGHDPHSETRLCRYLSTPMIHTHTYSMHWDMPTQRNLLLLCLSSRALQMNGFQQWTRWLQGNKSSLKPRPAETVSVPPAACWSHDSLLVDHSDSASCDLEEDAANISFNAAWCCSLLTLRSSHENTEPTVSQCLQTLTDTARSLLLPTGDPNKNDDTCPK